MTWPAVLACCGAFVGAVLLMGGLATCVEVWRVRRRAAEDARRACESVTLRAARCRLQAVIDAEARLHGYSRLSEQLVAEGVPA